MLCSQYGNPLSFYGNIQLGFYNPPLYTWGAWELPYPEYYQPPLTKKEERVIERHREPEPIIAESIDSIVSRMQHQQRMTEIVTPAAPKKYKRVDTDDEDSFILM